MAHDRSSPQGPARFWQNWFMSALVWLVIAIVLVGIEMFGGELVLLMLAGGALAAAGVDYAFDAPLWVDGVVFAAVSLGLLTTVRPVARRHMLSRPPVATNAEALEGRDAVVVERVDEHDGRVKLAGEIWSARTDVPGAAIAPGSTVIVVRIDGATAVVLET